MRARRALRPRLDAMENRIALSGLNAQSLVSAIHLPFLSQQKSQHRAARPDAHPNRRHAAHPHRLPRRHAVHHPVLVHTHGHGHPAPKPKSSSSSNIFSQFFKSAFGGL